jgi:small Trp-rich protein
MWLVGLGVILVLLKLAGFGFVAAWPWWVVLAPFALAAVWWKFADSTGMTQRAAMRREDEKAAKRREAQFESLGLRAPRPGSGANPPPRPERSSRSDN